MYCKTISAFSFLLFACYSAAQNLVPNGSFEIYSSCPSFPGEIYKATSWFQPNKYGGTIISGSSTDYYHVCNTNNSVSIPGNNLGFQYARTDKAYAGLSPFFNGIGINGREYLEVELIDSLGLNKKYCISFYLSFSDKSSYAIDKIGAYFSKDSLLYSSSTYTNLQVVPQVINKNGIIKDTLNWILISGSHVASGGEKFITIGNFNPDSTTNVDTLIYGTKNYSYYYIDDVSVYEEQNADAGADKLICKGDSISIGSPAGYGLAYKWSPAEGLNDTTAAEPVVSPSQTTTYILTITDTAGTNCIGKGSDTVTVYVKKTPLASAGKDTLLCKGNEVLLGSPAMPGYGYAWQPADGLSDAYAAQPVSSPQSSIQYLLTVTDTAAGCSSTDTILIKVEDCFIQIPSILFYNDKFEINNLPDGSRLEIYNMLGQKIFKSENYMNTFASFMVQSGIYLYRLILPDETEKSGIFEVIK